MSGYIKPQDVRSPRDHVVMIKVLFDGGEGEHALAIIEWDGHRRLGWRYNGTDEAPAGNPQSRGYPTWFVVPPGVCDDSIIEWLPVEQQSLARALYA